MILRYALYSITIAGLVTIGLFALLGPPFGDRIGRYAYSLCAPYPDPRCGPPPFGY